MTKWLIADVGSTTTKALFIENSQVIAREETATTVEKPFDNVEVGLQKAVALIKQRTQKKIEDSNFLFTSSAGGGLQVIAVGITGSYTAKNAYRLATGVGAIVIETLAFDDGRTPYERLDSLNKHRPDLILFTGGFENGAINQLVEMAELIMLSDIHPKFEETKLPIIYAGNSKALPFIENKLQQKFLLKVCPNITPKEGAENFLPTRNAIIDTFVNHVMSSAPGYKNLLCKALLPPLPTPLAVEKILKLYSTTEKKRIFAFDMGGATTDCYTVSQDSVVRTVAANLGITYSLPYVLQTCGIDKIMNCLNKSFNKQEVLNFIGNRYIRPTTISETEGELQIEEAIVRNIIAQAVLQHKEWTKEKSYDIVICSGGFFAHHPDKMRLKKIVIETLKLPPKCSVAVDNHFILPHLGSLSRVDEKLALKLFSENVCFL